MAQLQETQVLLSMERGVECIVQARYSAIHRVLRAMKRVLDGPVAAIKFSGASASYEADTLAASMKDVVESVPKAWGAARAELKAFSDEVRNETGVIEATRPILLQVATPGHWMDRWTTISAEVGLVLMTGDAAMEALKEDESLLLDAIRGTPNNSDEPLPDPSAFFNTIAWIGIKRLMTKGTFDLFSAEAPSDPSMHIPQASDYLAVLQQGWPESEVRPVPRTKSIIHPQFGL